MNINLKQFSDYLFLLLVLASNFTTNLQHRYSYLKVFWLLIIYSLSSDLKSQASLCSLYGTVPFNAIYLTNHTINSPVTYTDKYIVVDGDLTINNLFATFTRCTLNITAGSQIIINSHKRLRLSGCLLFSCGDGFWNGIFVKENGLLICNNSSQNRSQIENAANGIILITKSKLTLQSTDFNRNNECIYIFGTPTIFRFSDNIFSGVYSSTYSNIGIHLDSYNHPDPALQTYSTLDIENIATGINEFNSLKYGITGVNASIKIQNCQFNSCNIGINNSLLKGRPNYIKGLGKESSIATFSNNNKFNIYIEGDSYVKITDCKFFIDNRFTSSHLIPGVNIVRNKFNGGSILIENNSFIDELYHSTYANPGLSNTDLYFYFCPAPGGCVITNNSFKATNHSEITKQLIVQCAFEFCDFVNQSTFSGNTFELNNIYCEDIGLTQQELGSNAEFNGCFECVPSRSLLINFCYNMLISDNYFKKHTSGATSTEISGVSNNINCEVNNYEEINRRNLCDNVGIRVVGSTPELCANYFLNNFVGLDALGGSSGTIVASNTFDGNYTGVHYFSNAFVSAQIHTGNLWENDFTSNYRLIHDQPATYIDFNQYLIDPNNYNSTQHYWPETFKPVPFILPHVSSLNSCLSAGPFDPFGPEIFTNLPYGPMWEGYYFSLMYMENGGEFENSEFEALYDSLYNLPIYKLMRVDYNIKNLNSQLESYNDSLAEIDLTINDVTYGINVEKQYIIEDSIETGFLLDSLYSVLDSLYTIKEFIYIDLINESNEIIEEISSLNDSIEASSVLEENRITLNEIVIKLYNNETLTEADSIFLRNTSLVCGLDEGNNGVKARSIIRSYYQIELPPIEECEEEVPLIGKEKLSNKEHQNAESLFNSNSKNFSSNSNTYEIYDILYRKVSHGITYNELQMCSFIPGIYIVKEKQNNNILRIIKIWLPIN